MTTVSPGMWARRASRLCECWLPDDRPAPNWVRTVNAISAAPPVMNGSFAAWLSSWSRQTPRKSRYKADDGGLRDGGVSHPFTELISQPTRQPEDVATGTDVDPGDEDALVVGQLGLEGAADRVHGAEDRGVRTRGGRFGVSRSRTGHKVGQ